MNEIYLLVTAIACLCSIAYIWHGYRDPLHPLIAIGVLFFAGYVIMPYMAINDENVQNLIDPDKFETVLLVNLLLVSSFIAGCLWQTARIHPRAETTHWHERLEYFKLRSDSISKLVVLLGAYAHFGYWLGIINVGGFVAAYSRHKGGGAVASGYLGDASLAAYPAALLYAVSRSGKSKGLVDLIIVVILLLPNILHGTFGGRRGPLFIVLVVLAVCALLLRGRPVRMNSIVATAIAGMLAVTFIGSQRSFLYLGSGESVDFNAYFESLTEELASTGGTFVTASGTILTSLETGKHPYGRSYLVNYVIRPIPRQLMDKTSLYEWARSDSIDLYDWLSVMGWLPQAGYATGFVADLFSEFRWWSLISAFFFGALPGFIWVQHIRRGGVWLLELALVMSLVIYLPFQSVSAFLQRFLFVGIILLIGWRVFVQNKNTKMQEPLQSR